MRKILAVAAAAAAVTLAGCSSGPNLVDAYHKVAHAMPAYSATTDANLDKAGKGICKAFDADPSTGWDATVNTVAESSDMAQAHVMVKAAVAAYCPDHTKDIPNN